jgi:hypothetical protein
MARHLIDAGGPNVRVPKARQLVVTELIGHDVNDVGFIGGEHPTRRQHQGGKEKQTHHHLSRYVERPVSFWKARYFWDTPVFFGQSGVF